jgi:hypothetical protein
VNFLFDRRNPRDDIGRYQHGSSTDPVVRVHHQISDRPRLLVEEFVDVTDPRRLSHR